METPGGHNPLHVLLLLFLPLGKGTYPKEIQKERKLSLITLLLGKRPQHGLVGEPELP